MANILKVEDLSISFGGIKAVQHVSFEIGQGEVIGLIGPNGSGKSTCVNLISGAYIPDTGIVTFDGHALHPRQTIAHRAKMGMGRTFQTPRPFGNLTVFDNIYTVALQKYHHGQAVKKTEEVLEFSGLAEYRDMKSSKISIEKRKWMDLARILAIDCKFIMMDEVMAGLNPSEMSSCLDLIKKINKEGVTILFIEHIMKAVLEVSDRVIVLKEGMKLCEGPAAETLARPDVVEAYLGKEG
jgi:branched-chain amino acid transport system ATP-binding protein